MVDFLSKSSLVAAAVFLSVAAALSLFFASSSPKLQTTVETDIFGVKIKGKKKKGLTLSLAEFSSYKAPQANQAKGLTPGDLIKLPTGPRERTAEEMDASRIGEGFRSYGMGRSGGGDGDRWGGNWGFDEPRRDSREPLGPSRADEIDDWRPERSRLLVGMVEGLRGGRGGGFDGDLSFFIEHSRELCGY